MGSDIPSLKKGLASAIDRGKWKIKIVGDKVTVGIVNAWIDPLASKNSSPKFPNIQSYKPNDFSISIPGTAMNTITVGNYNIGHGIFDSSSKGPTRDGRVKPDIISPGTNITSCASGQAYHSKMYVRSTGTSMSSPCVTGIIALLFEKNPSLTLREIMSIISDSSRTDLTMGKVPNNTYGYGIIDAVAALRKV
ncbi:MAG: S8 family serine peptidase [Nitrososphaeraceae archaeon]